MDSVPFHRLVGLSSFRGEAWVALSVLIFFQKWLKLARYVRAACVRTSIKHLRLRLNTTGLREKVFHREVVLVEILDVSPVELILTQVHEYLFTSIKVDTHAVRYVLN